MTNPVPHTDTAPWTGVTLSPDVLLSVPVIADAAVLDRLYAASASADAIALRAFAMTLGLARPSWDHEWVLGWEATGEGEPDRLVWYDPHKLTAIAEAIAEAREVYSADAALVITHGRGWDDWSVDLASAGPRVIDDPWAAHPPCDGFVPPAPAGPAATLSAWDPLPPRGEDAPPPPGPAPLRPGAPAGRAGPSSGATPGPEDAEGQGQA